MYSLLSHAIRPNLAGSQAHAALPAESNGDTYYASNADNNAGGTDYESNAVGDSHSKNNVGDTYYESNTAGDACFGERYMFSYRIHVHNSDSACMYAFHFLAA